MKKLLVLTFITLLMSSFCIQSVQSAETESVETVKNAILKYKNKNYIGCISDLKLYTTKEPTSVISWYYLGNAYMKIAMKTEAASAFDKVILLNTVPQLTSYSLQAKVCMQNPLRCKYQNFTLEEINKLKADPITFLDQYFASLNKEEVKSVGELEIEKLINGYYSNNIHPSAKEFIMQERLKIKQSNINNNG